MAKEGSFHLLLGCTECWPDRSTIRTLVVGFAPWSSGTTAEVEVGRTGRWVSVDLKRTQTTAESRATER